MTTIVQLEPRPTNCHECGKSAAEPICSGCGAERPAFTAVKNITAQAREARARDVQPLSFPLPACRYYPKSLCDCGLRGCCVPAA